VSQAILVVGLTGGIACGKSTVAKMLGLRGCRHMDADMVVHAALEPLGAAYPGVVSCFGPMVCDAEGRIDRAKLAALVFESPTDRRMLESILHPLVFAEQDRRIADWTREGFEGIAIIEAALILEAGVQDRFDRIVVVGAYRETQLRRLEATGMEPRDAAARIDAQMPVAEKAKLADYVIPNDGGLDHLEAAVDELTERLLTDLAAKVEGTLTPSLSRKPGKPS